MTLLATVLGGHFYIKIDIAIIFTTLNTNSLLSFFFPFVETKKKKKKNQEVGMGGLRVQKKVVTNFYKINIIYITVITIIFAVIVVMIVISIINTVDVAFGYWSMMI